MLTYWLMFLVPAVAALGERARAGAIGVTRRGASLNVSWIMLATILSLLIGYRHEVGGDWGNYLRNFEGLDLSTFAEVLIASDPGYRLLEWLAIESGGGIYVVNLIGGTAFAFGLVVFCRSLPRPWLALVVAVPYLIIVVAMGYSRQGIALGFAMFGLVALGQQRYLRFLFWVFVGATFHKSAVLLLPIAALASTRKRLFAFFWAGLMTVMAYLLLLQAAVDDLREGYIEAQYQSEGALIRLTMNLLPAVLFLIASKRFEMAPSQRALWRWFSLISVALFVYYFISPSSTAVDRIALYMLPLQLVIFSYFPNAFGKRGGQNQVLVMAVIAYYAAVEFVWLNFAIHASGWIPYKFYPLEWLGGSL